MDGRSRSCKHLDAEMWCSGNSSPGLVSTVIDIFTLLLLVVVVLVLLLIPILSVALVAIIAVLMLSSMIINQFPILGRPKPQYIHIKPFYRFYESLILIIEAPIS